jgi:hypothetical protein
LKGHRFGLVALMAAWKTAYLRAKAPVHSARYETRG